MNPDNVKKAAHHITQAMDLLARGPLDFYLKELAGAYEFMMARCCPFKVGDEVELAPIINKTKNCDWMGSKNFLVAGAAGRIESAECGSKGFTFEVTFYDESWIGQDGVKHPIDEDKRHTFIFDEFSLIKRSITTAS